MEPVPDGFSGCRSDPGAWLRPARHGPAPRQHRRQDHLHVLPAGVGHPRQRVRCGADRAAPVRAERRRRPGWLGAQPRARRHGHRVPRPRGRSGDHERRAGGAQGAVRRVPGQSSLRHRPRHQPGTRDRSLRRDDDAVCGHRLGPRPAPRQPGHRADPGVLAAVGRANQPGTAMLAAERRAQHRAQRGAQ